MRRLLARFALCLCLLVLPHLAHAQDSLGISTLGCLESFESLLDISVQDSLVYGVDPYSQLFIFSIADTALPRLLGSCKLQSVQLNTVTAEGNYAYVGSWDNGMLIVDVSDPAAPVLAGNISDIYGVISIAVSGNYAYVGAGPDGFHVLDVSNPGSPFIVGSTDMLFSELMVVGGSVYGTNGAGLYWIDVSDPANPVIRSLAPGAGYRGFTIDGSRLYATQRFIEPGSSNLQIFNLTAPGVFAWLGSCPLPGYAEAVAVKDDFAYVFVDLDTGLAVVSVADPTAPTVVGFVDSAEVWYARSLVVEGTTLCAAGNRGLHTLDVRVPGRPVVTGQYIAPWYLTDIAVADSVAYFTGERGMRVVDLHDPTRPRAIGQYRIPYCGHPIAMVSESLACMYSGGKLAFMDVHDPTTPRLLTTSDVRTFQMPEITIRDTLAYLSMGCFGMQIVDISDPAAPDSIGGLEGTAENWFSASSIAVSGSYAYTAGQTAFYVVDVSDPYSPHVVSTVDSLEFGVHSEIVLKDGCAYVASRYAGLFILDIRNPLAPVVVDCLNGPGYEWDVAVAGDRMLLTELGPQGIPYGLRVFDIRNPAAPQPIGYFLRAYDGSLSTLQLAVVGNMAVVARTDFLDVFDISAAQVAAVPPSTPAALPSALVLHPCYPNPFNSGTMLSFALPRAGRVTLDLFDITGRRVARIADAAYTAGEHRLYFGASDLASGVYFLQLRSGAATKTQKLLLLR